MVPEPLRTALIIGGSRGIGAASGRRFAGAGYRVVLTYHRRGARAAQVVAEIEAEGGVATALPLDVCDEASCETLREHIQEHLGPLDVLVLCASGGLEPGASPQHAANINTLAPARLVDTFRPTLADRCNVIFLTSHEAHFSGRGDGYGPYARIAISKKAGEARLLAAAPLWAALGITLKIVSADIVEGTATAKLLERNDPGLIDRRKAVVGRLPTPDDVALEVLRRTDDATQPGWVTYVWAPGAEYAP